jgi:anti-sigma B factor antagonist
MDLDIASRTDDSGRAVLVITGAIDLQTRDRLIAPAQEAMTSSSDGIILDLAGVDFMDSTGIGALVEISREASDAGADFSIQNPSDRVLRILEITGLTQAWDISSPAKSDIPTD